MGFVVAIIIGFGVGAGVLALTDGKVEAPWFLLIIGGLIAGVTVLLGGVFGRDHSRARDINGEIEGKLQDFSDRLARLHWQAKSGRDVSDQIVAVDTAEKEFRATIEYGVVTDGSENYYSYKN